MGGGGGVVVSGGQTLTLRNALHSMKLAPQKFGLTAFLKKG